VVDLNDRLGGANTGDVHESDSPALAEELGRRCKAAELVDVVCELYGSVRDEPLLS
jgi:hypothetical protein